MEHYIRSGIIEPSALAELLEHKIYPIKLLDATFVLPGSGGNPEYEFKRKRIDQAQFFNIEEIADHNAATAHMLPKADAFAEAVSRLGISNDDFVVIYGQEGMVMGPARAWWMFRCFGHDKVCVLNGGLPAWIADGYNINNEPPSPPTKPAQFSANFKPQYVRSMDDVKAALETEDKFILDARPEGRFCGQSPEPRAGLESGHIPGSCNVPAISLVSPETGKLKSMDELREILAHAGYGPGKENICSCGSGVTACVIALALHHIGEQNYCVYDGSWAEWGQSKLNCPIEKSS